MNMAKQIYYHNIREMAMKDGTWYSQANKEDRELFRKWLVGHLAMGKVVVSFTKTNGDHRDMTCTLDKNVIPMDQSASTPIKETKDKPQDHEPTAQSVWDVNANAWRSFRWDKIKQISFTLGE